MFDSNAITRMQSVILAVIIVVAAVAGSLTYLFLSGSNQSSETIKIGLLADLDMPDGRRTWQGIVLAAEQLNAEGGLLGRQIEVIAEDDDSSSGSQDLVIATNAFTKLATVDNVDLIIFQIGEPDTYQELASQHEKILIQNIGSNLDELSQKVLDDYDHYKYYFRPGTANASASVYGATISIVACSEYTGFTKIAFLDGFAGALSGLLGPVSDILEGEYGLEIVSSEIFTPETVDFSSYFAKAEAADTEIIYPVMPAQIAVPFVKEWYDRQSPTVIWGTIGGIASTNAWELTEGKCEHITTLTVPVVAGYPFTSKSVPTKEAYDARWGESITNTATGAYDILRFILSDAIKRAGTIETEALIKALETTDVETSIYPSFRFTASHDIMTNQIKVGDTDSELKNALCFFQWQNEEFVPVWPEALMDKENVTYTYPDWPGPWDNP